MKEKIKRLGKDALFYYYYMRKPKSPKSVIAFHLYIETTNKCNYKCIMCAAHNGNMKRKSGFMDFGLYKQIIDEASDIGIKYMIPHIWGESLLHPNIIDMIRYAKESGMRIELTTNGFLLDEKMSRDLLKTSIDEIIVSFHGMTPSDYRKIHGVDGFYKVIGNVKALYGLRKEGSLTKLKIHTTIMDNNFKDVHKVFSIFRGIADGFNITNCDYNPYDNKNDCRLIKSDIKRNNPCFELFTSLAVSWDGKIGVCCGENGFSLTIGDMKDGLLKAFNSEKLNHYRKLHALRRFEKIPVCLRCLDYDAFRDSIPSKLKRNIIEGNIKKYWD